MSSGATGSPALFLARTEIPASFTGEQAAAICDAFGDIAQACAYQRIKGENGAPWNISLYLGAAPELVDLQARLALLEKTAGLDFPAGETMKWHIEAVAQRDWLAESYKSFAPFSVGRFFIYGSHYEGETPEGQSGLLIDAATAFGSGAHGTTKGCLQAMLYLKDQGICPWNVLDMGAGSGILALAAWELWKTPVLGIDNDAEAVRVAVRHREANRVPGDKTGVIFAEGDGFAAPEVRRIKPFDLIIANILAGPLREMAPDLKEVSDDNGYVILSGILNEQADNVLSVYEGLGLTLRKHTRIDEWSILVLQNF